MKPGKFRNGEFLEGKQDRTQNSEKRSHGAGFKFYRKKFTIGHEISLLVNSKGIRTVKEDDP